MDADAERIGQMAVAGSGSEASRPHSQGTGSGGQLSAGQFGGIGKLLGGGGEAAAGGEGLEALALLAL